MSREPTVCYYSENFKEISWFTMKKEIILALFLCMKVYILAQNPNFYYFTSQTVGRKIVLHWETNNIQTIQRYIIERADDPTHLAPHLIFSNDGVSTQYTKNDTLVQFNKIYYYRLIIERANLKSDTSDITVASIETIEDGIYIKPYRNIATEGRIQFEVNVLKEGEADLFLMNMIGQKVLMETRFLERGKNIVELDIRNLMTGYYVLLARKNNVGSWQKYLIKN